MAIDFDTAVLDPVFEVFAKDAVYTQAGGQGTAVKIVPSTRDQMVSFGQSRIHAAAASFEMRTAQGIEPAEGDTLTLGSVVYTIKGFPRRIDEEGLIWLLDTYQA